MAKNKITDLRDHLFAQLERLGEEEIKPEQLEHEVSRANAIASIGNVIVNSAKAEIQFMKMTGNTGTGFIPISDTPKGLLESDNNKSKRVHKFLDGE